MSLLQQINTKLKEYDNIDLYIDEIQNIYNQYIDIQNFISSYIILDNYIKLLPKIKIISQQLNKFLTSKQIDKITSQKVYKDIIHIYFQIFSNEKYLKMNNFYIRALMVIDYYLQQKKKLQDIILKYGKKTIIENTLQILYEKKLHFL